MATNISGFGSRFTAILDPYGKRIKHGAMGMFLDRESELIAGVEAEGVEGSYLPFSSKRNGFQAVYMASTMNSVSYQAISKEGGYDLTLTITSPFIPGDDKLNSAPFFHITAEVKRNARPHNLVMVKKNIGKGRIVFGLRGEGLQAHPQSNEVRYDYMINTSNKFVLGDFARTLQLKLVRDGVEVDKFSCSEWLASREARAGIDGLFTADFDLDRNDDFKVTFIWAAFMPDPVMTVKGDPCLLLYTNDFRDASEVLRYAFDNEGENLEKSRFFDSTVSGTSLSQNWKDFMAFTFQSYKMNTLHGVNKDGKVSFSVWEGNCMYNSTMDVEYNNGLFYYAMYPQLLEGLLQSWADTEQGKGYIAHDLGYGFALEGVTYGRPMKVEENCNFILMLFSYYAMYGQKPVVEKHYAVLKNLIDFMLSADTTGNGIPDQGTSNTVDDSIPAIQHAKQQTYLAIKTVCSYRAFAKMARMIGDEDSAKKVDLQADKIIRTVDSELWKDDHYIVCLDESQEGYKRFLTGELLSGEMEGRDTYSIYAENGLLYPFMAGLVPEGLDYARLSENIYNSFLKCDTRYGCNHSSEGSDSIWISQNLWRDFSAAYMGHDLLDNVDKYWEFQKIMNSDGRVNLFIDTYGENALWYYPRGLTSAGVFFAMLRLKIDGINRTLSISPLRNTVRMPLPQFADWKNRRIPWVVVESGEDFHVENDDLLRGWNVKRC